MKKILVNLLACAAILAVCLLCFRADSFLPFALPAAPALVYWIILMAGMGLIVAAEAVFLRRGGSTGAPADPTHRLVTGGIYGWVRNPIYLGGMFVLLGISLAGSSPFLFLLACLYPVLLNFTVVRSEEDRMERDFGEAYREYKHRVPRWIPRPPKKPPKPSS